MYAEPDLATMQRVRAAFDPEGIANPDKLFPRPRLCGADRLSSPAHTPHPAEAAGLAEIF